MSLTLDKVIHDLHGILRNAVFRVNLFQNYKSASQYSIHADAMAPIDNQTSEDVDREVREVCLATALLLGLSILVVGGSGDLLAGRSFSSRLVVLGLIGRSMSGASSGNSGTSGTISGGSQSVIDCITVDTAGRNIVIDLSVSIDLSLCIRHSGLRVCDGLLDLGGGALLCDLRRHD